MTTMALSNHSRDLHGGRAGASGPLERLNDALGVPRPRHPGTGAVLLGGVIAWVVYTVIVLLSRWP